MKNLAVTFVLLAISLLAVGVSGAATIEKGPVRQFTKTAPSTLADSTVPPEADPGFEKVYYKVQNYRASYLADTVRLMLTARGIIQSNDDLNVLIISDEDETTEEVLAMLKEVDSLPEQIVIRAKVLEVNNTLSKDNGINIVTIFEKTAFSEKLLTEVDARETYSPTSDSYSLQYIKNGGRDTSAQTVYSRMSDLINFLVEKDYAKVIAEPKIVTVNNKKGRVFIGDRVKLARFMTDTGIFNISVENPFMEPMKEEAGIILEVTPHIADSRFITMDIMTGFGEVSSVDTGQVQSYVREAQSTVIVKSGEPIVIGGYKTVRENTVKYEFPVLGSIPVIKKFFSKKTTSSEEIELLMILVPEIVRPGQGLSEEITE